MFTEFGVRIPFSSFQQRLLQRCFVAQSQFHPNAWSSIRCFELVTEYLELPQDPEVFLYLFTVFSPNAEGRYFKVFPVGDHPPFWLTLERDAGRFPSYWSKDAGLNYIPVSYKSEDGRREKDIGTPSLGYAGESSRFGVVGGTATQVEVSSPIQEEGPEQQVEVIPSPPSRKRGNDETTAAQKRPRVFDGSQRDLCPIDRSFDASGFIESNFLGPRALEALHDYDPMESTRWVQWAMLRSATILKSVEPRLTMANQWERRCTQLSEEMKLLDQRRADLEKEKASAEAAKSKVEKDLEVALGASKEKDSEVQRLKEREVNLLTELEALKKQVIDEKARADKAEASLTETEQARQELIELAKDSVKATEDNLKEQILVLSPDFDVSLLGAWKEVVDGKIVDPPPEE
ncbi:hypothetical protein PIB30_003559 [Stylosanthes scabra]|uniref:Transposase (Putative), gypsy type n=1 Tax=Stylosanthes scabra TaxID=79078 RepID=A0ABU6X328_9FABA|nr:hypothetical protein [Stylosanthes scabra]